LIIVFVSYLLGKNLGDDPPLCSFMRQFTRGWASSAPRLSTYSAFNRTAT